MAGEQYADKAIAGLYAYLSANLPTYIAAVETAQGLAVGALGRPEYLDAEHEDDNREIVLVYSESSNEFEGELKLATHNCVAAWHFHSDADLDAGKLKGRRIMTAMKNVIDADPTLGASVTSAIVATSLYDFETDTSNATRHAVAMDVRVVTYDG